MKFLTVVGARPQFIKAEPLVHAIREAGHDGYLVHTGQHWDFGMSEIFFEQMRIPSADVNLGAGSGLHGEQTGRMLAGIESVILRENPHWVIVMGDTNSTLAGALAAAKLNVPLAHVEAGLRSFNRCMPEEINRVLTDHAAEVLFAPTATAVENLLREGIARTRIEFVGDVMYDAFLRFSDSTAETTRILRSFGLEAGRYVLATVHRAENTDDEARLRAIFEGLQSVALRLPVLLPLHPRTRDALTRIGLAADKLAPLRVVEPLGYLQMLALERHAAVIASDSGGIQKEAFFARVPCVTFRNETEWIELVEHGWNRICPPLSATAVAEGIQGALGTQGHEIELYGGGQAAARIVACLGTKRARSPVQTERHRE